MFMASPRATKVIGVVTVSGHAVSDSQIGSATAGVRWNSDGTVDENITGSYSQIDAATDWIIPNGTGDSTYEIRASGLTGDTPSGTFDTWLTLDSNREWTLTATAGQTLSCSFTIEIRKDGGAAIDSATYTLDAAAST